MSDMFAIVEIAGKQYKVSVGESVTVDRIPGDVGSVITLDKVLMLSDGKKTDIGTPYVKNVHVTSKITSQEKGEKINVRRYKSKVRYRRSRGFRPMETTLLIEEIA